MSLEKLVLINNLRVFLCLFISILLFGCGSKSSPTTSAAPTSGGVANSCLNAPAGGNISLSNPPTGLNVLPVVLNGQNYSNEPTVTIKFCNPGTNTCVSVSNILVDTGSYGLRVFGSTLSALTLPQINSPSGNSLAECAQFGIGSTWGPIKSADVILGTEAAVTIPIQIIDASFGTRPTACANSDTTPSTAGYNGILGVGLFKEDCGPACVAPNPAPSLYYSCIGAACSVSNAPLASQVVNPVGRLATDNNGVILELPSIPTCGAQTVTGALTLGIGTRANNTPAAVTFFQTNNLGEFTTTFNGQAYTSSFIDSGTNVLFFPRNNSLPSCTQRVGGQDISTFDCPLNTVTLSATQISGATQKTISFQVNNAYNMFLSPNYNFNDIAANLATTFDWGLPFFYGRKVFVGIDGTASSLGTGPYWAY